MVQVFSLLEITLTHHPNSEKFQLPFSLARNSRLPYTLFHFSFFVMKHLLFTIAFVLILGCRAETETRIVKELAPPLPPVFPAPLTEINLPSEREKLALIKKKKTYLE